MNYFNYEINCWDDWCKVFHSREEFTPLIHHIFEIENLPKIQQISDLSPGTNGVFKVDDKVVKIFVPIMFEADHYTESYGLKFAEERGIAVPKLIRSGTVYDKYKFNYMIMEYIEGKIIEDIEDELTDEDKFNIGKQFAEIIRKLNVPCDKFNDIDIIKRAINNERWNKYPDSFNAERIEFLKSYKIENPVFVHGDINPDNVIWGDDGVMYLIDFADACIAPALYESALLFCFFDMDRPYIGGFGNFDSEELLTSFLLHDFGGDILTWNFDSCYEITSLDILRERIKVKLCRHQ